MWLSCGRLPASEAAGHDDDHGPVDVGFVVDGQPFVIPDGPAMAGDPRQRPLNHPTARQHFEGMQVIRAFDDLRGQSAEAGSWPR